MLLAGIPAGPQQVIWPLYVNMVRDPIDRFLSGTNYLHHCVCVTVRNKTTKQINQRLSFPGCNTLAIYWREEDLTDENCKKPLHEIVQMRIDEAPFVGKVQNHYTAYFAGHDCVHGSNSSEALQVAQQRMRREFAWVGVLERTKMSMELLRDTVPHMFKGRLKDPPHKVHDGDRHSAENIKHFDTLTKSVQRQLRRAYHNDYQLYTLANELLETRAKMLWGEEQAARMIAAEPSPAR